MDISILIGLLGFLALLHGCSPLFLQGNSSITLNSTINLAKNGFSLKFRSCNAGTLIYQENTFKLRLEKTSLSNHSSIQLEIDNSTFRLNPKFSIDTNYLVTIFLDTSHSPPILGVIGLFSSNISISYKSNVTSLSSRPVVGLNFTGCIFSGNNIDLLNPYHSVEVVSHCPLDDKSPCINKVCPLGYTGQHCETDIDDCGSYPCHSYSKCIDQINSYYCVCGPQWTGKDCSTFLGSLCSPSPCKNNALCRETLDKNNFTCICQQGFYGRLCESVILPCNPNPCMNGGTCKNTSQTQLAYECACKPGFAGINCELNINDCAHQPCDHGTCIDGLNNFTCNCNGSGYTGRTCSEDVNECKSLKPCQNNATCKNFFGGYSCSCIEGWTGKNCENDVKECQQNPNPCKNNGACIEESGSYSCKCSEGYTGVKCETNINDCNTSTLCGNGTCIDGINNYSCSCFPGFSGRNCQINNNECTPGLCQNGGVCIDGINNYRCNCLPSYTGAHCENFTNPCFPNPCANNGTCLNNSKTGFECDCTNISFGGNRCQYKLGQCFPNNPCKHGNCSDDGKTYNCTCFVGYKGVNCTEDINECSTKPCNNSGTCINTPGSYYCNCTKFTEGVHCDNDVQECKLPVSPCKNNGRCYNREYDGFDCVCSHTGYTGPTCETRVYPCKNKEGELNKPPCNNGTCIDGLTTYSCSCFSGYTGDHCQTDIDECQFHFCKNNATCKDMINDYNCNCTPGFTNKNCSENINECLANPCQNNGTCHDLINAFSCSCPPGFNGTLCEVDIDWCAINPCKYGGNCTDGMESHTCTCNAGFTGKNCEVDINECSSNPCQNQGVCMERSNVSTMILLGIAPQGANETYKNRDGYVCQCPQGTNGTNCEVNFDDCLSSPCLNNGTCHDMINDFNCTCQPGYTGKNCSLDINECDSSPCLNNGTCENEVARFVCQCPSNFTGTRCETTITPCITARPCKNGAECVVVGSGYICNCSAGYTGYDCQFSTNLNFNGSGYWQTGTVTKEIELLYRTTLQNGLVVYFTDGTRHGIVSIDSGKLGLSILPSHHKIELSNKRVNDGFLRHLRVLIMPNFVLVTTNSKTINVTGVNFIYSQFWVGGTTFRSTSIGTIRNFTGCVQDIKINNTLVAPSILGVLQGGAIVGNCTRNKKCLANTCNHRGACIDNWVDIKCSCKRRFVGETCAQEVQAFSFAVAPDVAPTASPNATSTRRRRRDISSTMNTTKPRYILYEDRTNFTDNTLLSFYIRTRDHSGVLTTISTANANSGDSLSTYLSLQLLNGVMLFSFRHTTQIIKLNRSTTIADGQWHGIEISKKTVKVDETTLFSFNIVASFPVRFFYFGGVDNMTYFQTILASTIQFQGCMQDILFEGKTVTNQNVPGRITAAVNETQSSPGCNGTDVCGSNPCLYGGTCNDLWNAFNCSCQVGFAGKQCAIFGCALQSRCVKGTECLDIPNKPGQTTCTSSVTFNGQNQSVNIASASINGTFLNSDVSFYLRTRRTGAVILSTSDGNDKFVGIGILSDKIFMLYNFGSGEKSFSHTSPPVTDGKWHNIHLYTKGNTTSLSVDKIVVATTNHVIFGNDWRSLVAARGASIGKTAQSSLKKNLTHLLKGCLHKFFLGQNFVNLNISTPEGPRIGCVSDNHCRTNPCVQGNCLDIFNDYSCNCPVHYTGKNCDQTVNVTCAIKPSPCKNGASCQNLSQPKNTLPDKKFSSFGSDFFNCSCTPRFTGLLCQDYVNPCNNNPCMNNGTCRNITFDTYQCNCTPEYRGKNCQIKRTACDSDPCQNNGVCTPVGTNFTCQCAPGFDGYHCQINTNPCVSSPCRNSGSCTPIFKKCQSGNTCRNKIYGEFNCTCTSAWLGSFCAIENPCSPNPCKNGGTCILHFNGTGNAARTCQCASGYKGSDCKDEESSKTGLYIGIGVACFVFVILLIILVISLLKKDKGGMYGTYSPKKEEKQVEMKPVAKPKPKPERLI